MIVRPTATGAWTASLCHAPRQSPGKTLRNMYGSASERPMSLRSAQKPVTFRPNRFTPRSADPGNMIGQPERVYKHAER